MTISDPNNPNRSDNASDRPQLRPGFVEPRLTSSPDQIEGQPISVEARDGFTPCRFNGIASEYFKIWIVNIALMLVTLGIYSAWAKVRRNQYIYGNTYFEQSSFIYHADPKSILIGRLIFFIPFAALLALNYYDPILANSAATIVGVIAPFFIVRAVRFRWRVTTYRGVAFKFTGTTFESFVIYLLWPIVAAVSAFLLHPLAVRKRKHWLISNSYFGNIRFAFHGTTSPIFWIYARVAICVAVLISAVSAVLQLGLVNFDSVQLGIFGIPIWIFAGFGLIAIAFYSYINSRVTNYVWNNTSIKNTSFKCNLSARRLYFLYITNLLAIIASLGLLIPWSVMRLTKYRVESIQYSLGDNIDDVVGIGANDKSALGEEAAGMFDLDFG